MFFNGNGDLNLNFYLPLEIFLQNTFWMNFRGATLSRLTWYERLVTQSKVLDAHSWDEQEGSRRNYISSSQNI